MAKKDKVVERTMSFHDGDISLRADADGNQMITGTAIVYERESLPIYGSYIEVIKAGALSETDMTRVVARTNHDDNNLLGTTMGGTLRLVDTPIGLNYEVDIPDTVAGRDTTVYMQRGDIAGSSFAFVEDESQSKWIDRSDDGMLPLLEIYAIRSLHDVAPVINPAYPDASSALRGYNAWVKEQDDIIEFNREEEQRKVKADSDTLAAINNQLKLKR